LVVLGALVFVFGGFALLTNATGPFLGAILIGLVSSLTGRALLYYGFAPILAGIFTRGPIKQYGLTGTSIHHPKVVELWQKIIPVIVTAFFLILIAIFILAGYNIDVGWFIIAFLAVASYVAGWFCPLRRRNVNNEKTR
jgi:hypothetical protein